MSRLMNFIFELPYSLFQEADSKTHGANKITKSIMSFLLSLNKAGGYVYVVTDATEEEFKLFQSIYPDHPRLIHCTYLTLYSILERCPKPDFAFTPDLSIQRMLYFRNAYHISFPVIGLIHSIGTQRSCETVREISSQITAIDGLICPSSITETTLRKLAARHSPTLLKNAGTAMPYGIDTRTFCPSKNRQALRAQFNLSKEEVVILHVSRITPFTKMDIFPLIHNFEEIKGQFSKAVLLIVGEVHVKEYMEHLQNYIEEKKLGAAVRFITQVNHNRMMDYYQAADIFVSMTDHFGESFGLSVIEAMACGLPVILSDLSGYRERVENGREGFVIPTIGGDPGYDRIFHTCGIIDFGDFAIQSIAFDNTSFREALTTLVAHPEKRRQMGGAGRKKIKREYEFSRMTQKYKRYFETKSRYAKAHPLTEFPKLPLQDFSQIISHCPTMMLTPGTEVEMTSYAKAILADQAPFIAFQKHLKTYVLIPHILAEIKKGNRVLYRIQKALNHSMENVIASVLFMLKHDLLYIQFPKRTFLNAYMENFKNNPFPERGNRGVSSI